MSMFATRMYLFLAKISNKFTSTHSMYSCNVLRVIRNMQNSWDRLFNIRKCNGETTYCPMSFSDIVGSWTKTAAAASTMTGDIRAVLSPLLTISFIFGTRITEFPAGQLKPWYSSLYIVLLWSTYYTLLGCTFINYIQSTSFLYQLCFWMNTSTALLSFLIGTYYNKVNEYVSVCAY